MAGENQCYWASWFKANYEYSKLSDSGFDSAGWKRNHAVLIAEIVKELKDVEVSVLIEDQTKFFLEGQTATLSGQADIIAYNDDRVVVYDAKTVSHKSSDIVQVQIYMWCIPRVFPQFKGRAIEGVVRYNKEEPFETYIPPHSIDGKFATQLVKTIKDVAGSTPLLKVPSLNECKWCNISSEYCPERIEEGEKRTVSTLEF